MEGVRGLVQWGGLTAFRLLGGGLLLHPLGLGRVYSQLYFRYKRHVEAGYVRALDKWIEPGSLVIDVGAHIGFFTLAFAGRVREGGAVLAFEPAEDNARLLRWNLARSGATNAVVVCAALSDRSGAGVLYLNPAHPGDHQIFRNETDRPTRPVRLLTLDEYLEAEGFPQAPSLIKVDVQGAELKVAKGMIRTLEKFPAAALLVEFAPSALAAAGDSAGALLAFFQERGYRAGVFSEAAAGFRRADYASLRLVPYTQYTDVLFSRRANISWQS
jgi:FkbM family methyltransferase